MLIPKDIVQKREDGFNLNVEKMCERLKRGTTRADFTSHVLQHSSTNKNGLTKDEMCVNAAVFVFAGSETTSAMLSGCLYYLLRHTAKHERLVREIRGAFNKASDIKLAAVSELEYLDAVLKETLRIYPPVPAILPRIVPEGGAIIDGRYVPAGVSVGISLYLSFNSATNFKNPDCFAPERWLTGPESAWYESDNKEAFQPFSYGPQNCLGQKLANAEMRLILTKLLWHFDFDLPPESIDWSNQKSYSLWVRPPLMVNIRQADGVR